MPLRTIVLLAWGVFGAVWLIGAFRSKPGRRTRRWRPPGLVVVVVFVLLRVFRTNGLVVGSRALEVAGVVLLIAGLGLAVVARVYLGANWGMPMTEKDDPELVTSGPYRFVRHPIYSGILLAVLGTALATNILWLVALAALGAYFVYSATVEERLMASTFPATYPGYRARTKMLIPFVL